MSYASLLFATKQFLIDTLTYDNKHFDETMCDVTVDGRPPSNCGEVFVAVHAGGFRGNNPEILDAFHSLNITLTFRCADTPFDRLGMNVIVQQSLGMGELCQKIVEIVGFNYEILRIANDRIPTDVNRWVEPLRFSSATPPRLVGGEWFHANDPNAREEALVQSISFGEARRVQFYTYQPYPTDVSGLLNGEAIEQEFNLPPNLIGDFLQPE